MFVCLVVFGFAFRVRVFICFFFFVCAGLLCVSFCLLLLGFIRLRVGVVCLLFVLCRFFCGFFFLCCFLSVFGALWYQFSFYCGLLSVFFAFFFGVGSFWLPSACLVVWLFFV